MIASPFYKRTNSLSIIVVGLLIAILGIFKFTFLQTNILSYDYFGLYLYLPATFIYHDPAISNISWLENINALYHNTPMFYQLQSVGDFHLIRFFCGMAILLSPFFFLGHIAAIIGGYTVDGFSAPYQLAMTFAAFFYVAVGIVFVRKILLHFFTEKVAIWTLIALYLGTNLFFWTTFDAGAPHTILFTLYAVLIWFTIKWHKFPKLKYAIFIGLTLGLIIVSRPSEIIAVFIPLFWNIFNKESLIDKFRLILKFRFHFFWLILATSVMGLPQIWYYHHYTGNFYFSTYTDPQSGLDFSNPRFAWVLFSFRKGWFIYAPIMIFSIIGLPWMIKSRKKIALPILSYFLINLLIIASFTSLVSYGWRAFIQSYAIMMIPLGYFIKYLLDKGLTIKILSLIILIFFILLSVLQSWQIMNGIIDSSRMTKDYYFRIFGKTNITENDKKLLRINPYLDDETGNKMADTIGFKRTVLKYYNFDVPMVGYEKFQQVDNLNNTNKTIEISQVLQYSPAVKIPNNEITDKEYFWARISFIYKSDTIIQPGDLLLVATYTYQGINYKHKNAVYKYRAFKVPFEAKDQSKWQYFSVDYLSPEITTPKDRFETYVWYRGKNKVLIDNFCVTKFEP